MENVSFPRSPNTQHHHEPICEPFEATRWKKGRNIQEISQHEFSLPLRVFVWIMRVSQCFVKHSSPSGSMFSHVVLLFFRSQQPKPVKNIFSERWISIENPFLRCAMWMFHACWSFNRALFWACVISFVNCHGEEPSFYVVQFCHETFVKHERRKNFFVLFSFLWLCKLFLMEHFSQRFKWRHNSESENHLQLGKTFFISWKIHVAFLFFLV